MPYRYDRLFLDLAALVISAPAIAAGLAGYVLYFQSFGDWSAICARDEAAGIVNCTAESPAPTPATPPAVMVRVTETAAGIFAVTALFRANVAPGAEAALRIDDGTDRVGTLDGGYEVRFGPEESAALVADMLAGRQLTLRAASFGSNAQPIHVGVPLATFSHAFQQMRLGLRQHGAIRDLSSPPP